MVERGQKLNEIEDQMENMSNEAKQYAQTSQALKNMYKNKKWYQLWTNIVFSFFIFSYFILLKSVLQQGIRIKFFCLGFFVIFWRTFFLLLWFVFTFLKRTSNILCQIESTNMNSYECKVILKWQNHYYHHRNWKLVLYYIKCDISR